MAKLESMSDNEFEHDYPGPGPQAGPGPSFAMEEDPLFDPLGLPDEGQLLIQHQHMMGAPAAGMCPECKLHCQSNFGEAGYWLEFRRRGEYQSFVT